MENPCVFSADRRHRYTLEHIPDPLLDDGSRAAFIGLNPSTADENDLDPTLRRIRGFTQREGLAGFIMLNLFAYRATDPKVMRAQEDPIGADNDRWIVAVAKRARLVVAAWGNHGSHLDREREVAALLARHKVPLLCLGKNANGTPKHPLYVASDTKLIPWP